MDLDVHSPMWNDVQLLPEILLVPMNAALSLIKLNCISALKINKKKLNRI
jgi:hypothetical protein